MGERTNWFLDRLLCVVSELMLTVRVQGGGGVRVWRNGGACYVPRAIREIDSYSAYACGTVIKHENSSARRSDRVHEFSYAIHSLAKFSTVPVRSRYNRSAHSDLLPAAAAAMTAASASVHAGATVSESWPRTHACIPPLAIRAT